MFLYDTLGGKKKRVANAENDALKMFVCGPTVYDYAHIGHARTYIVFDALARYLKHIGFKLFYLQNITDIDDKIINRAQKNKKHPRDLARFFEKEYLKDMRALGVISVDKYARASGHLKEIRKQINALIKKKIAYQTDSGVYFEVKRFPDYGKLSRQDLDKLRPGWRIEPDPQKKDPVDFALWKKTESSWSFPSPWGRGRPGWHIEDTAISEKYLGQQYDLHGAAVDLKFPHHESEIAQQESISGKKPFVRIWIHAGFLLVSGEKMSKSLNNFITVKDFLKKYDSNVLRLLVLSHHYRSPVNYTDKLAEQYQNALENINKFLRTITINKKNDRSLIKNMGKKIDAALDDDFNTPKALAEIFSFLAISLKTNEAKGFVVEKLGVLGITLKIPKISAKINGLMEKREGDRQQKNFITADKIRNQIKKLGFYVED